MQRTCWIRNLFKDESAMIRSPKKCFNVAASAVWQCIVRTVVTVVIGVAGIRACARDHHIEFQV